MKQVLLILLFSFAVCTLHADVISVNFAERENQYVLPDEAAGLAQYAARNFNNVDGELLGASHAGLALLDESGADSGAQLSYVISNWWGDGDAGFATPDARMSRGHMDDGQTTDPIGVDIYVANVPFSQYTVVVYHSTGDNGVLTEGFQPVTVNGVTQRCETGDRWANVREWIEGTNCLVFKNVTGSDLDITVLSRYADGAPAGRRGPVAGIQIINEVFPTDPSPAAGAVEVPIEATLEWSPPGSYDALEYDIYIDPNVLLVADGDPQAWLAAQSETSIEVSLLYGQTYYWRVDAVDPNEGGDPVVYPGRIWTFSTEVHPSTLEPPLYAPGITILNPSFEEEDRWWIPTPGWFDYGNAYQEGPFFTPYGSVWGVAEDGMHWQAIGTWTPDVDYQISLVTGKRPGWGDGQTRVALWAGGTVPETMEQGRQTTPSGVGATLIADHVFPPDEDGAYTEHSIIINTGTGWTEGDPLHLALTRALDSGRAHFDMIRVNLPRDPRSAWGPVPHNGQRNISISVPPTLVWQQGVDPATNYEPDPSVTGYHIYFGSDQEAVGSGDAAVYLGYYPVGQESIEVTQTLREFTTYYWRVDQEMDGEVVTGPVWRFTTDLSNRLIAHWKFDGNLNDEVAMLTGNPEGDWPGAMVGDDPNYAEGIDGQAIRFYRGDGNYLTIPGSEEFFNFYSEGFTVNIWYKPDSYDDVDGFMGLISKRAGNDGWQMFDTAFFYSAGLEARVDTTNINPPGRLDDGDWHMATLSYDGPSGVMSVYLDGALFGSAELEASEDNAAAVAMGVVTSPGNWEYAGLIDDVRIFSYALEPLEVALMYVAIEEDKPVCLDPDDPALRFDFTGDCKVGLADFALMAQSWMACNLYPECF